MSVQATAAKSIFLGLPRQEQVELMQFFLEVIANIPDSEGVFEISEDWKQELNRREAEILNGSVKGISLEQALKDLK